MSQGLRVCMVVKMVKQCIMIYAYNKYLPPIPRFVVLNIIKIYILWLFYLKLYNESSYNMKTIYVCSLQKRVHQQQVDIVYNIC